MNNVNKIINAINFIEENICSDITLEVISEKACISKFHFQRIFQSIVGDPLSTYLRNRRLSLSLKKLLTTKEKIVDIAFFYQFNSHEAYIRAFKSYFNTTPYLARRNNLEVREYTRFNPTDSDRISLASFNLEKIELDNQLPLTMSGLSYTYIADDFSISKQIIKAGKELVKQLKVYEYCILIEPENSNNGKFIIGVKGIYNNLNKVKIIESKYISFNYNGVPRRIMEAIKFLFNIWIPNNTGFPVDRILIKYPANPGTTAMYNCDIVIIFKN